MNTITLKNVKILGRDKYSRLYCKVIEGGNKLLDTEDKFKRKGILKSPISIKHPTENETDVYFICKPPKFYEFDNESLELKNLTDFKNLSFKFKLFAKAYKFTVNNKKIEGWCLKTSELVLV